MKFILSLIILNCAFISFCQEELIFEMSSEKVVEKTIIPQEEKYELGILDSVKGTLDKLIPEMDSAFIFYAEKYPDQEISLRGVTTYNYASKDDFVEKSITQETGFRNYSIQYFQHKYPIQLLYLFMNEVSLTTKKYDKNGVLIEKGEFRSDSKEIEKYTSESIKSKKGDTLISKFYTNGYLTALNKIVYPDKNCTEIWHYNGRNELSMKSNFCYDGDKHLSSEFENFSYAYHTQEESFYHHSGLLQCKVEKRLHDSSSIETDSYYNENKQKIKTEEFKNGLLSFTRLMEYDNNGNLILEKGIGQSGKITYQCIYEYDSENNKILYLYYYFI
ncbi:MAG: hypothetical protein ACK5B9_12965 [Flavobacteriia bacterium]|jgi:hypothetical protein